MNSYEVAVLYHPDLEIDLEKPAEKVEKIFTDNGGKITNQDNWGKRKLAYKIKGHDHAIYVFYSVDLPAQSLKKIENTLNITDEIIRFLIVKPDTKAITQAENFKAARLKKAIDKEPNVGDEDEQTTELKG